MNNQIQIFSSPQFGEVRIVLNENNEPLFCLADLCRALNLTTPSRVKERLDDDMSLTHPIADNLGRTQEMTFVTEPGMYTVILRSDSLLAKPMQKWVTSEVLPSIRKHGMYATEQTIEMMLSNPDMAIQLLTNYKEERSKRIEAENQLKELKPKAELMEKVLDSGQRIDIGQAAKILQLPYGRNKLFKKLRDLGIFFQYRNEPKQEYIDKGYFILTQKWIDKNDFDGFTATKVLITQKGLDFIAKKLGVINYND